MVTLKRDLKVWLPIQLLMFFDILPASTPLNSIASAVVETEGFGDYYCPRDVPETIEIVLQGQFASCRVVEVVRYDDLLLAGRLSGNELMQLRRHSKSAGALFVDVVGVAVGAS